LTALSTLTAFPGTCELKNNKKMERSFHRNCLGLMSILAMLWPAVTALGETGSGDSKKAITVGGGQSSYATINQIGEADQQISLKDGKLLAHRRGSDPFGIASDGKFKNLPRVAEHPATPSQPNQPVQAPVVASGPTLEQAIEQLPIGGVNIGSREVLIGPRSVHEGDLLVLELSGQQFVVWVQSVDRRGVQFCDVTLQRHALKPFRFGPDELPASAEAQLNVRNFLNQDAR
jgi:hypothetical protein